MPLTLLIGPARSGKSDIAVRLGRAHDGPVTFIATAEGRDEEMRERIRRHRADRPSSWTTVEAPVHLERAIGAADPETMIIVDCLTLWVSNLLEQNLTPAQIAAAADEVARAARDRTAPTVVVTNEVGAGIVPAIELARVYRDVLGHTNRIVADAAHRVFFVSAGRVLAMARTEEVLTLDVAR